MDLHVLYNFFFEIVKLISLSEVIELNTRNIVYEKASPILHSDFL